MSGTIAGRVQQARRQRFERLVGRALDELPPDLLAMLDNVAITVEDEPLAHHLDQWDDAPETLFGLYEGTPLTERDSAYGMTLPDRITIFRGPLERAFRSPQAIAREVLITVAHELGHHFGLDEDRLEELGLG